MVAASKSRGPHSAESAARLEYPRACMAMKVRSVVCNTEQSLGPIEKGYIG